VSGEVRNIGRDAKQVPPVRISLRDTRSHEIFELVNVVTNQPVESGASVPFQIRVENPPDDAVDLEATFASFSEATFAGGPAHVSPSSTQDELLLNQPLEDGQAAAPTTTSELGPIEGLRFSNS
jgi:hypothetical protein